MIKKILLAILSILFIFSFVNAAVYNEKGDFKVEFTSQKQLVYNDNMNSEFILNVQNLKDTKQDFKIILPSIKGWDIETKYEVFNLNPQETKEIKINFVANSDFDYSTNLVAPDVIKISQKEDYKGYFEFPIKVSGEKQNVSVRYQVEIEKKEILPQTFSAKFASEKLSPISPLRYTVIGENIVDSQEVEITLELNGQILNRFKETFSKDNNYKIFQTEIPSDLNPGNYNTIVTIKVLNANGKSAQEWYESKKLEVTSYEKVLIERKYENTLFGEKHSIILNNTGNIKSSFTEEVKSNFFTMIFLTSNPKYTKTSDGFKIEIPLEKGQNTSIHYSYNYMFVYVVFIIFAFIAGHFYMKSQSNPLKVESRVYEVKRVEHEGIKSLRIKLDFENMKEQQIEELKLVFKMPSYLNVKEGSFLLVEPNHVLKGRDQYKLVWDFKKFEHKDSRIIGFTLVNSRGVLGDISVPDIEFEVKINGKTTKYYEELPVIRY